MAAEGGAAAAVGAAIGVWDVAIDAGEGVGATGGGAMAVMRVMVGTAYRVVLKTTVMAEGVGYRCLLLCLLHTIA